MYIYADHLHLVTQMVLLTTYFLYTSESILPVLELSGNVMHDLAIVSAFSYQQSDWCTDGICKGFFFFSKRSLPKWQCFPLESIKVTKSSVLVLCSFRFGSLTSALFQFEFCRWQEMKVPKVHLPLHTGSTCPPRSWRTSWRSLPRRRLTGEGLGWRARPRWTRGWDRARSQRMPQRKRWLRCWHMTSTSAGPVESRREKGMF